MIGPSLVALIAPFTRADLTRARCGGQPNHNEMVTTDHGAMRMMVLGCRRLVLVGVAMAAGGSWGCTYAPAETTVRRGQSRAARRQ